MGYFSKTKNHGNHQPDYVASSVDDIDFMLLAKNGIRCVAFDIDGTLTINGSHTMDEQRAKIVNKKLDAAGIKKRFIASNSNRSLKEITDILGTFEVHQPSGLKGKPSKEYYSELVTKTCCKPSEIAMIGDRVLQDIWGAKRSNLVAILVSLNPDFATFRDKIILRQIWQPSFVGRKRL